MLWATGNIIVCNGNKGSPIVNRIAFITREYYASFNLQQESQSLLMKLEDFDFVWIKDIEGGGEGREELWNLSPLFGE